MDLEERCTRHLPFNYRQAAYQDSLETGRKKSSSASAPMVRTRKKGLAGDRKVVEHAKTLPGSKACLLHDA